MKRFGWLAAAAALMVAVPANAGEIVQNGQSDTSSAAGHDFATISRFDPTLGTLTEVKLQLSFNLVNGASYFAYDENGNEVPTTFVYTYTQPGYIFVGRSVEFQTPDSVHASYPAQRYDFYYNGSQTNLFTGGDLSSFIGTGSFEVAVSFPYGEISYLPTPAPYVGWEYYDSFIFADFTLIYRFQAVPEPVTWAMMVLGLGLISGVMRLRPTASAMRRSLLR